jgi:hypothetical protein
LRIETASEAADNPACTRLNLCAVLSQLGRHEQAMLHARAALELLHDEATLHGAALAGDGMGGPPGAAATSVLAIAYHNYAVEQEFCGLAADARRSYSRAAEVRIVAVLLTQTVRV